MFAVIRSGGKQYRVTEGETLLVERAALEGRKGDKIKLEDVILVGGDKPKVGAPTVKGASVEATVVREMRGDKIVVLHKKKRKNHTKTKAGHRQNLVEIRIDSIKG